MNLVCSLFYLEVDYFENECDLSSDEEANGGSDGVIGRAPGPISDEPAAAAMPGLISVAEFVDETKDDVHSPTTSTFVSRMPQCRQTVAALEEVPVYRVLLGFPRSTTES